MCNGVAADLPKYIHVTRRTPLLCELHSHTTFSDGSLTPRELVDLYGFAGFDVLAVTDHICRREAMSAGARALPAEAHADYLACLELEAERAWQVYRLLLIPGLELTYDDSDPALAAHAVAVGLRSWASLDDGLDAALTAARADGAALIGAHPYTPEGVAGSTRGTARFAAQREWSRELVHRFELYNRHEHFPWVAEERLPVVANGDFHRLEHLETWKTLLPCEHSEEAVLDYLRSGGEVGLVPFETGRSAARLAASAA